MTSLQTVVELPEFLRRAKAVMSDEERAALVDYVAANPKASFPLSGSNSKLLLTHYGDRS